ncbi:acyltransferase family protein [Humibacter ginsenosidimutans]|uniref:acyltransferase family protein n=1 Tax=Humibacter ginsenosidimutans TaxID=2599293 RepID=UPI00143D143E|nr:acyltransferase family protein [Humibacter ginsenosidimutans]
MTVDTLTAPHSRPEPETTSPTAPRNRRQTARRSQQHSPAPSRGRDGAVDLARAWCLIVVVLMHSLMVGVSMGAAGPVLQNALDGWPGLVPFTWAAQIMPLFFVLGGFSAFTQYTALSAHGVTASDYVALRMRRLLRPAVAAISAIVAVLAALTLLGVPAGIVTTAGFRLSQPLWFLGVYALTTALVPAAIAAHRRARWTTVGVLAALVVAVDVVRGATGIPAVGFINLAFVWLLVQQLGFWLAEKRMPSPRLFLAALALAAYGALAVFCTCGVYSFDLLSDLNPRAARWCCSESDSLRCSSWSRLRCAGCTACGR